MFTLVTPKTENEPYERFEYPNDLWAHARSKHNWRVLSIYGIDIMLIRLKKEKSLLVSFIFYVNFFHHFRGCDECVRVWGCLYEGRIWIPNEDSIELKMCCYTWRQHDIGLKGHGSNNILRIGKKTRKLKFRIRNYFFHPFHTSVWHPNSSSMSQ